MEDEPINQNYLIGYDTIEHSPSLDLLASLKNLLKMWQYASILCSTIMEYNWTPFF